MAFLESVANGSLDLVDLTQSDVGRIVELVSRYDDLPLGTTDASVIAVAERLGVDEITTLDHRHFRVVRQSAAYGPRRRRNSVVPKKCGALSGHP